MNGLLLDVLKCCGGPLLDYVTLFQAVWEEKYMCPKSVEMLC